MSPQRLRAHRNFPFILSLALVCCGVIALAISIKAMTASADTGRNESGAPDLIKASPHNASAAPVGTPDEKLRGRLTLFGYNASERAYISTLDLTSGLETVVRMPGQNGRNSMSKPKFSPDGSKIVYAEAADGFNIDVYVMNADGTNRVNLSNYPADPGAAFNCRFADSNTGVRNVAICIDTSPAWSHDGQHIAFISGRNGRDELYVMNADGTNLRLLPSRLGAAQNQESGFYGQPSWSPDGSKIVYSYPTDYPPAFKPPAGQTEIAVLTLDRREDSNGNITFSVTSDLQLTANPLFDLAPAWSPDGSKIAFHRFDPNIFPHGNNNSDMYMMNADGSNQLNLSNTTDRHESLPIWSPDGSKIAFTLELFDPTCTRGCFDIGSTQLTVLDLNSSSLTHIETQGPTVYAYSWIDPCNAPANVTAKSANLSSSDDEMMLAHAPSNSPASATTAAPQEQSTYKCIKEIVVNVTTDAPDTDPTNEFCDSDENAPGNQCSLRAAIQEANARPGIDHITFDIPGEGLHTIAPTSELPDITGQVAIDATSQPGYAENAPVVELSGAAAGAANGLNVRAGGVRIAGLIINRFTKNGVTDKGIGIYALDTLGLRVQSCFIGTDAAGMAAAPNEVGVYLRNTTDSTIGSSSGTTGNLISGNEYGVSIFGGESIPQGNNNIFGNRIGVDRTGAGALGNKVAGVIVTASTHNNIGGETSAPGVAPGNVITGNHPNASAGVFLGVAKHTTVAGNLIGTDSTGTKGFGNGIGVYLSTGSTHNTIGGYSSRARNVISGNKSGLDLFGPTVNDNLIFNNYIGTDITGLAIVPIEGVPDYPQQRRGITIEGGSRNTIGDGSGTRNVVAGNAEVQISILRPEATDNRVDGNYVGLFADGNTSPSYDQREIGIWINGATKTVIGEDDTNVISGNGLGVLISNPTNHLDAQNRLLDNYIGTNSSGTAALPNTFGGGVLITKSSNNRIEGNVISGNKGAAGISLVNQLNAQDSPGAAETKNNVLRNNYIGTNADVNAAVPNQGAGVFIGPGANENLIGKPGEENVISGNNGLGILIANQEQSTSSPTANKIQGNIIGLDHDSAKLPNTKQGIGVLFGTGTIIGGDTEDAGNIIAGNGESGIAIAGTSNTVRFNFIGTNREGAQGLGNGSDGIKLENTAGQENTIADNVIGGNGGNGINVAGTEQTSTLAHAWFKPRALQSAIGNGLTKIVGNNIGIIKLVNGGNTTAVKLANLIGGIKISETPNVVVSKSGGNKPNIIAGNNGPGILIEGQASTGNVVEGTIIGTDDLGTPDLGNAGDGVRIVNAPDNQIGGENVPGAAQLGNVIAGNTGNGIAVEGGAASDNKIEGNHVGVLGQLNQAVGLHNGLNGIFIKDGIGNIIGRSPGLQNLIGNNIGSNNGAGIMLENANATRISGNAIGTNQDKAPDLGNGGPGILMTGGSAQTIVGGTEEGSGNTITANEGSGVRIDETAGTGNLVDPNSIYGNHAYGIDLGRRGVTPNDFGDADTGPNRLQNYPEIIERQVNGDGHLIISYRLTSSPAHSNYGTAGIYIEFFKADPSGEGEKFLGFTHYTVADFNNGAPLVKQIDLGTVIALGINSEDPVTATASDASGNTSEFSPPYSSRVLIVTKIDDTNNTCEAGNCSLREALASANAGDEIQFASPLFDSQQTITLGGTELIVNKSVRVKGKGAHLLTISAHNLSRVFNITDGAMPTLSGLTITKGNAQGNFIGGGILNAGTLTLLGCHVTDNIAERGAGIYNTETLIVRSSTISLNKANLSSATPAGGGIQNANGGELLINNSTISGNEATVSDGAGGIYIADGTTDIKSSTITNNTAQPGASDAGGIKNKDGVVTISNSIVAANTAASADLVGAFTSGGYNLIGVHDMAVNMSFPPGNPNAKNDIVGTPSNPVNPLLDPLAIYGGTTPTHQLQAGSPAIDKGLAFGESTDQRGAQRPSDDPSIAPASGGDHSDIGAFEITQAVNPSNTPVGSDVVVSSLSGDERVTFNQVTTEGTTTFTAIAPPSSAGTPPAGYTIIESGPAFDITTTAGFTPPVTVCFKLNSINNPTEFRRARILHDEGGQLVDRTVLTPDSPAPDFATRMVCARADSLGVFVAALMKARTSFDFDGDGKADPSAWNPTTTNWLFLDSSTSERRWHMNWGSGGLGDISVPRDYDGDGKTDIAVWRPSEGNWYIVNSRDNSTTVKGWGAGNLGDVPVPADYDGDGKADIAIWRPSEGNWYIIRSSNGEVTQRGWGAGSLGDKPVPADYDGDGLADIAVWRPDEGNWYILNSSDNSMTRKGWGTGSLGDKPVPADYDGDGKTDIAVWRGPEGNWYIVNSSDSSVTLRGWGSSGLGDKPVPADYDGDGRADIAVCRPGEGNWYILLSHNNEMWMPNILQGADDVQTPTTSVP